MYSLEKIQKLFGDNEDFIVQNFITAVNYGEGETVGAILESIGEFLVEKRQDDLLELVDFYLVNHNPEEHYNEDDEDFEDFISPYIE